MKKILILLVLISSGLSLSGQSDDTTHYLFKDLKLSYLQYTIGYERVNFGVKDGLNAFYMSAFGLAFDNKLALGFDVDAATHDYTSFTPGGSYPKTSSYATFALNIEPLIKPKKLFNLSVPLKAGWGNASRWDTIFDPSAHFLAGYSSTALGYQVSEYSDNFFFLSAGLNGFINLWKPLSLGAGLSYRYAMATRSGIHRNDYSGVSTNVVLRWKFDFRAYNQKMMQRYRQYYQQPPLPATGN